ncbi:MAG: hypothetical protein MJ175_12890, partial [Clostridia bacterium]|nr:hypothetical protein [Clostridia bacterium]
MKNRTRSFVLALLTVSSAMLACGEAETGKTPDNKTPENTAAGTAAQETEAPKVLDSLPALDFGGASVAISHFGSETVTGHDTSDWDREQGDIVNDAILERDHTVEDRLNIKLDYTCGSDDWDGYPNDIAKTIKAADCPYDMIFMESSQCFRLCLDGYFQELSSLPYVDINQPWWYKSFMDGGAITTDKRYFLTGAFSISTLEGASATIFNKKLYNNIFENYNELYDLVRAYKWTYEKFLGYCAEAYSDVNGNSVADADDIFGVFNRGIHTVNFTSMSTGLTYLKRDQNGLPVLDLYNEDSIRWVDTLCRMLYDDNISYKDANINGADHFASGKAVFYLGQLMDYAGSTIRSMEDPYGVLPMPVLDEGMEYMSAAATVNGQSAVIPVTSPMDKNELYGAVLEAMNSESYRTVIPAWYEVALKSKYADTANDAEMIDVIYNTIDTSFVMIADKLLGTGSFFYSLCGTSRKDSGQFASTYEKQSKSLLKKWDKMIESYQ